MRVPGKCANECGRDGGWIDAMTRVCRACEEDRDEGDREVRPTDF